MPRPAARVRLPGLGAAIVLGLALGCGGDDGGGASEGGSSETGDEPPPRPLFSEPASGRLSLSADRTDDLTLLVTGVQPGVTELVIDDRSLGTLGEDAAAGRLLPEQLTLRLRGSMLAGMHEMIMRTTEPSGVAESEVIAVEIMGAPAVELTASPTTPVELGARRLLALGRGADAMLAVLDDQDEALPRLHLLPRSEQGWDVDGRRTVALPGLVLEPDAWVLPVTALRHGRTEDDLGRLRVAWRVGSPGTRIDLIDVAWDDVSPGAEPMPAPIASLTLDDALAGATPEWSELQRPWLLDDVLLAELWAPLDVESPRPGDRALVWTRVHDDPADDPADEPAEPPPQVVLALDPVQRVSVGTALIDLDRLGPVIDRVSDEADGPPAVTIRADQHQPLVLEHDAVGGVRVRPTAVDGRDRTFSFSDLPLCTVVGAFGSRTVAGVTPRSTGRLRVAAIDDLGDAGVRETSLGPDDLPPLEAVTAELAPSTVGGRPVFLVPFGSMAPVHAVHSTGVVVRVSELAELQCEAVAVADPPDPDGEAPLACARDGQLHLGTLVATPVQ